MTEWFSGIINDSRELRWSSVTYGNNLFVAIGPNRSMTSSDGITWSSLDLASGTNIWSSIVYGNGTYVVVGGYSDNFSAMTSSNGIDWTVRSTP